MTTTQQPEALKLSEQCAGMTSMFKTPSHERGVLNGAAQELRRLHYLVMKLESQLEAIGAGGVESLRKKGA